MDVFLQKLPAVGGNDAVRERERERERDVRMNQNGTAVSCESKEQWLRVIKHIKAEGNCRAG